MSTFVKSAILAVTITCCWAALSADSQTSQGAKGMGRDPIVQEVKAFLENCESRIVARSEIEYGKRYAELKYAHDRFISYMTIVGWGFSMLDVRRVFGQGGVDDTQVGYSITNLEKIMGRFGI